MGSVMTAASFSWISDRVFKIFPRWRINRRKGGVGGALVGPDTGQARAQGWPLLARVWPPYGPPSTLLLSPSLLRRNKVLGFCPVQFREYFLYNFSETQN